MFSGGRKRRKENDSEMDEFDKILVKFVKVTEECETKKRLLEAELEEKRRAEERKHEERMMTMMMTFMQSIARPSQQPDFRHMPPIPPAFASSTMNSRSPNYSQTTSNFPSDYDHNAY